MRARKQLALLAATLFLQEPGTLTKVRAFDLQVDGSCQGRAGPNTSDSFVPTSAFTASVYVQLFTAVAFESAVITFGSCCFCSSKHKHFLRKLQTSDLWEGIPVVCFNFKVMITSAGKA